jgi:putative membrane-bound dehydrogenase-like protein
MNRLNVQRPTTNAQRSKLDVGRYQGFRALAVLSLIAALAHIAATPSHAAPAVGASEPLAPQEERASFHLADPQLTVTLVAAEPQVLSPVAIAWDADGRMFVAEMIDYPTGPTAGQIRLLEDRDGDGRYERSTIFADNLPFPNGVLPWKNGLLVTAAPDIWYLKDTDGDGHADERRVVFTGFGQGNQQLRVNGLFWGLDNWVYGANGRSEGEIHRPGETNTLSIRGHDFRFRPEAGSFEPIAGRSQFGVTRDDWGNRFLSWNTIPIRQEVLPERYLSRNPYLTATESVLDILSPGDTGRVFPLTPAPLTFNSESTSHFNALAGLTVYRGDALGPAYHGNAFAGEALRNLVHRRLLQPDGITFVAQRGEQEREFLASTDPWFHPVNFATGPDGALYVVDFYRQWVEHPDFVPAKQRGGVAWRTGSEHGRIWRIQNSQWTPPKAQPRLSQASVSDLVKFLARTNGWWRDTAQRLLVEGHHRDALRLLQAQVSRSKSSMPLAQLHALYTLAGLEGLTPAIVTAALKNPYPGLREHGLRLAEPFLSTTNRFATGTSSQMKKLQESVLALADDLNPRVRYQLALSLGEGNADGKGDALTKLARRDATNRWSALAILSSVGPQPWFLLQRLIQQDDQWLHSPNEGQLAFLDKLAALIGATPDDAGLAACLDLLNDSPSAPLQGTRLTLLAGLADGLAQSHHSLRQLLEQPLPAWQTRLSGLNQRIEQAAALAASENEARSFRVRAIRLLGRAPPTLGGPVLLDLLLPPQPGEVQSASARAVTELNDGALSARAFSRWSRYTTTTRRQLLAASTRSPAVATALLDAVERGTILSVELDASLRQSLQRQSDPTLKQRATQLVKEVSSPDREEIVRRFEPALPLTGDRRRGAVVFAKSCLVCHPVQGKGNRLGPDVTSIASHAKETLLVDIFDPSRQVAPDYLSYTLVTTEGETVSGLLAVESANSVTLRRAGQPDTTVPRARIQEMRADGKSFMPDGLEQGMNPQDVADLLDFLRQPDSDLLPTTP